MGKKQHQKRVLEFELVGMALLTLSALALGRLGLVGRYLDVAFIYLAGSWSFLVPVFLGYAAIYMMVQRSPFPWHHRHMGLLILFIVWLTAMEFDLYQSVAAMYPDHQVPIWQVTLAAVDEMRDVVLGRTQIPSASVQAGGGLVGAAVFALCHRLFSDLGTVLVLSVSGLVGAALVTQRSLVAGLQQGTRWMERRLEALWKGSKQYIDVLFGPDPEEPKKEAGAESGSVPSGRRGRRKPELIVDGEVVESAGGSKEEEERPIVRDFSAQWQKHARESEVVTVEQVGNQLVARFPERAAPVKEEVRRRSAPESYPIGVPVRDDHYQLPPLRLFALPAMPKGGFDHREAQENARKLEATFESFGVQARVLEISRGPAVTRYEIQPAVGVKVSRILSLADDIALALAARDIRIEAPVPGKPVIGIEVPNDEISIVTLREVLESPEFQEEDSKLALALGRDISGAPIVGDLQKMPHLLVAGATGSGKSVCINGIIASILVKAKPHEVKFLMIDPKMVELSGYNGIPHLMAPVVTDPRRAAYALKRVVEEMENRYRLFAERGARDLERYNQMLRADGEDALPYIVVIIDELADLMMVAPGEVEDAICRIAQMARAAGIHLIVATQRPSVDVITGVIKANIPSRIAFAVSSMADSRTILDGGGAEKLLGRGDMLYLPVGASKPVRVQGAYVSESEIEQLVEYVKSQQQAVYTVDLNRDEEASDSTSADDLDELFFDAVDLVVDTGQASVSMIQRRFRVGYSRAARIVDQMEQRGLVGPFEGSKPREVLITAEEWQRFKEGMRGGRSH
ncbi:MAG: DNA translocase FtsK [Alicyclobacillus macrosporangiidus]|uniref:FtsK/SpoIIIE family DNA translocase n=1 Tax=Alicyclobacillus macrosporangiidus TaxID=392015 RepID=UPI0026F16EE5|nr:DNA translocase FtsK [Alicyclobacillus macrosporangiidus]MCL6597310.1 DNA translocase FtsK [Alicyclobacillus macrosporangiidus]